jgi:hypothetical protein
MATSLSAPITQDTATSKSPRPVLLWASAGALVLAFQVYVLLRWITGPNFKRTDPGPLETATGREILLVALQIAVPVGTLLCLYWWIVRPWRRTGHMTTEGMLAVAAGTLFFWDMTMNYTSVQLFYSSEVINFGSWANGSWPGWTSPGANNLPEPLFVTVPGYVSLVFTQVMLVVWLMRKIKARWPQLGVLASIAAIVIAMFTTDTIVEVLLLRTGIYAYPGGIRAFTFFAGHTYQLPINESLFIGGFAYGTIACLQYFRDDRGKTFVERGIETLKTTPRRRQLTKFLALYGCVHLALICFYAIPNQWFATHVDRFPTGYPAHLVNHMCQSGAAGDQCPGPDVPMPRP